MKILTVAGVVAALAFVSTHASADDSTGMQTKSHKQMMSECMAEQKAKNDGSTHAQRRATCKSQIKDQVVNQGIVNDKTTTPSH
jgi:hypothetical protein